MHDHYLLRAGLLGGGLLLAVCAAAQGPVSWQAADPYESVPRAHHRGALVKSGPSRHCIFAPASGLTRHYLADAAGTRTGRREAKAMVDVA